MDRSHTPVSMLVLLIPPILLILGFLLIPVLHLFVKGLGSAISVGEPLPAYLWPHLFAVTKNTFVLGGLTTAIALAIALPLAFLLVRTDLTASKLWMSILTIPMITPPFIMAFAVLSLYGRSGVLSLFLQRFGFFMPHIFGLPGLLINQLTISIPYATFVLAAGLQGVPRHIDESAASLGAHNLRIIVGLTIPCIMPHIIIAGLMIFLMAIGDVGGPLVIGGGFSVLSSEIYTNFLSLLNDERVALIFSLWIILLSFVLLAIVNRLIRSTAREYRRGLYPYRYRLGRHKAAFTIALTVLIAWLLAPFGMTLLQSFVTLWTHGPIPQAWSFANYAKILRFPELLGATLKMALITTAAIVLMGMVLGYVMYFRKKLRYLDYLLVIPFVLPGIVLAVGVLGAYAGFFPKNHPIPFYFLLLCTIMIRRLPYSLKTLEAGFLVADHRREEVARSLGSSSLSAFFRVTFPQMKPFIVTALIIGLVKTATELSASLILAPANWRSISLGIVHFIDQGQLPLASALSVVLVAVIGIGTTVAALWSRKGKDLEQEQSPDALERLILGRTPMPVNAATAGRRQPWRIRAFSRSREPLLMVVDKKGITDANHSFLRLVGADTLGHLKTETNFSMLFFGDHEVLELFTSMESIENRATSLMILDGRRIPIILNAYVMKAEDGSKRAIFYCKKVTGHSRRVREYARLRERMIMAEHMALKAQITPHFLFNSLNSVMHLIDHAPKEASETVQNLADLYRYILASTKEDLVPIVDEFNSIEHYLKVEKARFGDKLHYSLSIHPDVTDLRMPPMLMQPIVENAVNHGARASGEIEIKVSVTPSKDGVMIRIEDHGDQPFDPAKAATGSGTGLKNVEGRLFALYHRRIAYEQKVTGGLAVTMTIPRNTP